MMHARRKFYEARTSDPPRAHQALAWIKLLYNVEREAKEKHEAEGYEAFVAARHALRAERSRPIFKQFQDWLIAEAPKVLPKSPIGEAIQYALNHWTALERPLDAGFLELDNGACERAFKPVALGRKNWMFVGSDRGGETAAICLTMLANAKRYRIEPLAYVRGLLVAVASDDANLEALLPDVWIAAHPEHFLQYRRDESEAAAQSRRRRRADRRAKAGQSDSPS